MRRSIPLRLLLPCALALAIAAPARAQEDTLTALGILLRAAEHIPARGSLSFSHRYGDVLRPVHLEIGPGRWALHGPPVREGSLDLSFADIIVYFPGMVRDERTGADLLTRLPDGTWDGHPVHVVSAVGSRAENRVIFHIDRETFLVRGARVPIPHGRGRGATMELTFREYDEVEGFPVARAREMTIAGILDGRSVTAQELGLAVRMARLQRERATTDEERARLDEMLWFLERLDGEGTLRLRSEVVDVRANGRRPAGFVRIGP